MNDLAGAWNEREADSHITIIDVRIEAWFYNGMYGPSKFLYGWINL